MYVMAAIQFSIWDLGLVLAAAAQATALAYTFHPRWKAFLMILPIPFTFVVLSLGLPVGAGNVLGLGLWAVYLYGVYLLHARLGVNIFLSIAASLAVYCVSATLLAKVAPETAWMFWGSIGVLSVLSVVVYFLQPHRTEPGHRSPLPLWVKFPTILIIVLGMVLLKSAMGGFLAAFPIIGILAAYEARNSLWVLCRQTPVMMLMFFAMIVAIYLTQPYLPLLGAIAVGWGVYFVLLAILFRRTLLAKEPESISPRRRG
jgi:hypothetical protein